MYKIHHNLFNWNFIGIFINSYTLKKGDFNTPSEFPILKKENGGFDCYFKTAAWPHCGRKTSSATTAVFFITAG